MAPSSSSSSSAPLIKGYLPVRLHLPSTWSTQYNDETYFYVREHQAKATPTDDVNKDKHGTPSKQKTTLFVANAPVVPGVSTKILLQSIFGRFANLSRVTVVPNPRGGSTDPSDKAAGAAAANSDSSLQWCSKVQDPTFLPPIYSEGKFAHVVFETPKDMKKALRALQDAMKKSGTDKKVRPGLVLEKIEIQTLADETSRIYRAERKKELAKRGNGDDDDEGGFGEEESDDEEVASDEQTGILAVAARYRATCAEMSRDKLLAECNSVMQAYEEAEAAKKRGQELAKSQPDEDGFVTVSYSGAVGSQVDLEETKHASGNNPTRRKGNMRSRKKKEATGATELQDFYRFQRRENKKRSLEDLRAQFEEDLKRVKRMKDERHYRPF